MRRETQRTLSLLSFIALIIFTVSALLSWVDARVSYLIWVGNAMLLFVVLCLAYFHVRKLSTIWKTIYVIIVILAVISFLKGSGLF